MSFDAKHIEQLLKGKRLSAGEKCPGLFARGLGGGRVRFFYEGRVKNSPSKTVKTRKLGEFPSLSVAKAVSAANRMRADFELGIDRKSEAREQQQQTEVDKALTRITFKEHWVWHYHEMGLSKAKETTIKNYEQNINGVAPDIWGIPLRRIDAEYLNKTYKNPKNGSDRGAGRFIDEIKPMFQSAMARKIHGSSLLDTNPLLELAHLETKPRKRQGVLEAYEINEAISTFKNLEPRLTATEAQSFVALVFLALTGFRMREVMSLRWEHVYLEGEEFKKERLGLGFINVSVLKKKQPFRWYFPITSPILACLEHQSIVHELQAARGWDTDYIFPSFTRMNTHLYDVDAGLRYWNDAIPSPEFKIDLSRQGLEFTDVNTNISAHWLRHSYQTIGTSLLGFDETDVQRTFGKGVGKISSYTHDNILSVLERSLPVVLRIQAYILNPSLHNREQRRRLRGLSPDEEKLLFRQTPWFWKTGPQGTTRQIRYEAEGWLYADALSHHEDDPA